MKTDDPDRNKRTFLFLQGHPSRLWPQLADALAAAGHCVVKVHLSLADSAFWGRRKARTFRGRQAEWSSWLGSLIVEESVSDIVYYNDGFPYHDAALSVAGRAGCRAWCVEFGYFRPDWITLEPDGMGPRSRFPRDEAQMRALESHGSEPDFSLRFPHSFATEAFHEVLFNLVQSFGRPFHPLFESDRVCPAVIEYLSWGLVLARAPANRRRRRRLDAAMATGAFDYFLVAMQMEGDYQVRRSHYGSLQPFLADVLRSFAASAPARANLVVKAHPLEGGMHDWSAFIRSLAGNLGIGKRVTFVRGGELATWLTGSRGLVTLNSTTGIEALRLGVPTIALGEPVYDREGLTHGGSLESFWSAPDPVDREALLRFLKALSVLQIKGSFFHPEGAAQAVRELARRLTDDGPGALHRLMPS